MQSRSLFVPLMRATMRSRPAWLQYTPVFPGFRFHRRFNETRCAQATPFNHANTAKHSGRHHGTIVPSTNSASDIKIPPSPIWLPNERHTYMLGRLLAEDVRPGDVLLLHGELGAGKTGIARGYIHAARNNDHAEITSPTFLLVNVYPSNGFESACSEVDIYHMDLWRLDSASDRPLVNFTDVFGKHVSLIEWPDRLKHLIPPERVDVKLSYPPSIQSEAELDDADPWGFGDDEPHGDAALRNGRYVSLEGHGEAWKERVANILTAVSSDDDGRFTLFDQYLASTNPP